MIIVPTLLFLGTLVTLVALFLLRYCPERRQRRTTAPRGYHSSSHRQTQRNNHTQRHGHTQRHSHRHNLQGIDGKFPCQFFILFSLWSRTHTDVSLCSVSISLSLAPPGINPLEHEALPMSVQQVQQNVRPTLAAVPQMSTERHHGAFSQVVALPLSFSIKPNDTVSLYRARMDNKDVILRVLKGNVSCTKPNLKTTTYYKFCFQQLGDKGSKAGWLRGKNYTWFMAPKPHNVPCQTKCVLKYVKLNNT